MVAIWDGGLQKYNIQRRKRKLICYNWANFECERQRNFGKNNRAWSG